MLLKPWVVEFVFCSCAEAGGSDCTKRINVLHFSPILPKLPSVSLHSRRRNVFHTDFALILYAMNRKSRIKTYLLNFESCLQHTDWKVFQAKQNWSSNAYIHLGCLVCFRIVLYSRKVYWYNAFSSISKKEKRFKIDLRTFIEKKVFKNIFVTDTRYCIWWYLHIFKTFSWLKSLPRL